MLCVIYIIVITILKISSLMIQVLSCFIVVDFTLPVPIHLEPRENLWRQDIVKLVAILISLVKVGWMY